MHRTFQHEILILCSLCQKDVQFGFHHESMKLEGVRTQLIHCLFTKVLISSLILSLTVSQEGINPFLHILLNIHLHP